MWVMNISPNEEKLFFIALRTKHLETETNEPRLRPKYGVQSIKQFMDADIHAHSSINTARWRLVQERRLDYSLCAPGRIRLYVSSRTQNRKKLN